MLSLGLHPPAYPKTPAWLSRVYAYVGADKNPHRYENERDRAIQRIGMPALSVFLVVLFHHFAGTSVTPGEYTWFGGMILYAASSAAFLSHLGRHPSGGVHAQYAFMALDPLIAFWALLAAPDVMVWWQVLILVMIARVGLRYGLNAMKFELVFAWLGASLVLLFSSYLHTHFLMAISLVLMLMSTWWLFAPLHRSLDRAKALDIQNAKLQSLQESLMAKSEFLSRISHELRSPLQSVVSALDLIEGRYGKDPAEVELISRIRRGTTALHTQLQDLLTLGRGEVGKIEINPGPFEVVELALSVAREVQKEAWAKGLEFVVDLPAEPIFVVADPGRIDQVITNLLSNAIRHTKEGSVTLELHPYDENTRSLRFSVTDTGPGIDPQRMPRLFEPFTRYGEMTQKSDGAGLGLAVVKTVLDFLGGKIEPHSLPGHGTTFNVCIPAEFLDGEATLQSGSQGHRVLVVDDRPEVLEAISSVVRQLGFDCDTALSAATAANLLGARTYDIALVDLEMPVKTGLDLASETRRGKGPNSRTRIVSMSAAGVPERGPDSPFDGHLTKPITMLAIQRAIEQPWPAATATK
jgi:signal transduction histidine kinase